MWFWWYALACDAVIPFSMILFGRILWKRCPSKINGWYGYRTARSMKNMDTWQYAHAYFGRLWWRFGWYILVPSFLGVFLVYNGTEDTVAIVSLGIMAVQSGFLFYPIFKTENALKNTFDEHGNRR